MNRNWAEVDVSAGLFHPKLKLTLKITLKDYNTTVDGFVMSFNAGKNNENK